MRKTTTAEKTSTVKTSEAPAKETVTKDEVTGTKKETFEKLVKKPIGRPRKKAVDTEQKKAPKTTATKKTTKKTVTEEKPAEKIEEASTEVVEKKVRRTAKKEAEVYIQYLGKELSAKNVLENIKNLWTGEMGRKEKDFKDVKVYIKPEENKAYFVVNGNETGYIWL